MELSREMRSTPGLLYPMMIIAAIAVIAFSIVGIASIIGWMPHAMLGSPTAVAGQTIASSVTETDEATPTFQCTECGVIQSVREIEQRGSLWTTPVAVYDEVAQPATTGL